MRFKTLNLLFIVLLIHASCSKEDTSQLAPPEIPVFQTIEQDIPIYQEFVGQIYGFQDIAIRARVEGFLEGIHFEEGSSIDKGKLLYTLESQPLEAEVAAKMSKVAVEKTALAKAVSDLNRIRPLAEKNAVSQSDLDSAIALHEAAIASVEAAKANLKAANIQLGYTKIYSPITGIIGKTNAKVGDFVGRSPNPVILNMVSRIDTILVEFFITETQYLHYARRNLSQEESTDDNKQAAKLELILSDGSFFEHKGIAEFIDREVDPTTGAILIQASFPNPNELLRPGQFARVKAEIYMVKNGIAVPQRCIIELQGRYRVYVVTDANEIALREVTVGPTVKDFWLIKDGLGPGEKVVYEGLQKVKAGTAVTPVIQDIKLTF